MTDQEVDGPFLTYNLSANIDLKQNFKLQTQGSESKVYVGCFIEKASILKERFIKNYRHPELDKSLTAERIKAEVRALNKCQEIGIRCPTVYFADLRSRCIVMEEITNSLTVKEFLKTVLDKRGLEGINQLSHLANKIGEGIAKMHLNELVHGDLTTSNLLIKSDNFTDLNVEEIEVYFIDFGLSRRDVTAEDMAVDLYVLERAISSSHPNSEQFYAAIMAQYLKILGVHSDRIANKLEEVRQRGRKRTMAG